MTIKRFIYFFFPLSFFFNSLFSLPFFSFFPSLWSLAYIPSGVGSGVFVLYSITDWFLIASLTFTPPGCGYAMKATGFRPKNMLRINPAQSQRMVYPLRTSSTVSPWMVAPGAGVTERHIFNFTLTCVFRIVQASLYSAWRWYFLRENVYWLIRVAADIKARACQIFTPHYLSFLPDCLVLTDSSSPGFDILCRNRHTSKRRICTYLDYIYIKYILRG